MEERFNLKEVKVYRTTEAIVFETAFALMVVIVWGLILWMIHRAPDIVPTHFDASGQPNAYGSPAGIIIPCLIMTIVGIGMLVTAYFPRYINMPLKITNIRQVEMAVRFIRVGAVTTLLLTLAIAYTMLGMQSPSPQPILVIVALLFLEIIVFTILIYKAR